MNARKATLIASRSDIERLELLNAANQAKAKSKPNLLKRKLDFSSICEGADDDDHHQGKELQEKRVAKQNVFQAPAPESKSESVTRLETRPLPECHQNRLQERERIKVLIRMFCFKTPFLFINIYTNINRFSHEIEELRTKQQQSETNPDSTDLTILGPKTSAEEKKDVWLAKPQLCSCLDRPL